MNRKLVIFITSVVLFMTIACSLFGGGSDKKDTNTVGSTIDYYIVTFTNGSTVNCGDIRTYENGLTCYNTGIPVFYNKDKISNITPVYE